MTLVGVHAGLSVDHLVHEPRGARFSCLGGPGLYAALGARLVAGTDVRVSCPLPGDDPRFAALFDRFGWDLGHCAAVPAVPAVWILNSAHGRRIVSQHPQAGTELEGPREEKNEEEETSPEPPTAFFEGLDGLVASSPARRPAAAPGTLVGLDPHQTLVARHGTGHLRAVTTAETVLLPSRVQLTLVDRDPRRAARDLAAALRVPVIARLDREGAYVVTGDDTWSVRDSRVTVVETTGAGDASAGAVVAALAGGAGLVEAAAFGVSVARTALADWGPGALLDAAALSRPHAGITTLKEN
ncbi:PfkB family carbohydrate kinase [Streptomyces sp. NPDC004542]|uniref:PfkB family carbohydrate kinase n=1 Tax=Streptomyces sp. NPDC004542 TaxID=3154281 RepID=UPI0033B8E02A